VNQQRAKLGYQPFKTSQKFSAKKKKLKMLRKKRYWIISNCLWHNFKEEHSTAQSKTQNGSQWRKAVKRNRNGQNLPESDCEHNCKIK
jgi:hypothetical protein